MIASNNDVHEIIIILNVKHKYLNMVNPFLPLRDNLHPSVNIFLHQKSKGLFHFEHCCSSNITA